VQPVYGSYDSHIQSPTGTRSVLTPCDASRCRSSSVTHFLQCSRSWRLPSIGPSTLQKLYMSMAVLSGGWSSNW
jgi:hypothetical protein